MALLAVAICAPLASADAPQRRALLIGVNQYEALPDLHGAVNDVELMRGILTRRLGFSPENIRTVLDSEATRERILEELEALVAAAGPGDLLYVHYSGHGSQVPDASGDEQDDVWDETLVPYNGRSVSVRDVTDDEIGAIMARSPTDRVVVVLDSCHSGTATRSTSALRSRFVPRDDRAELYADAAPVAKRGVVEVEQRHVLLTASASHQAALDGPVDGRPHGLFSYALAQTLARGGGDLTPRDVLDGVQAELERVQAQLGLNGMPEPQLEIPAARLDEPLLPSAEEAPRLPWVHVEPADPGRARLREAVVLGAIPGSLWSVYPAEERAFRPGEALAVLEVESVEANDASGPIDPSDVVIPSGARAVPLAPPPLGAAVPVLWLAGEGGERPGVRAEVQALLPRVQWVQPGDLARFSVEVEGDVVRVLGADGVTEIARLESEDDRGVASALAATFSRWLTAAELLSITNPASAISLNLDVASAPAIDAAGGVERGIAVVSGARPPVFLARAAGTSRSPRNSLQLRVASDTACYLTLVDVDAEGNVQVVFPNAISERRGFHPQGAIPPGRPALIPDSLSPGNAAGFYMDYAPPAGTDTIRAFCNTDLDTAVVLRETIASIPGSGTPTRTRSARARHALSDVLRPRLARVASRGLLIVADTPQPEPAEPPTGEAPEPGAPADPPAPMRPARDWAAASVTIQVELP